MQSNPSFPLNSQSLLASEDQQLSRTFIKAAVHNQSAFAIALVSAGCIDEHQFEQHH